MSETEVFASELTQAKDFFERCDRWKNGDSDPHWLGQMLRRALREHLNRVYPESVFPTLDDCVNRDYGPMCVSELRKLVGTEETP